MTPIALEHKSHGRPRRRRTAIFGQSVLAIAGLSHQLCPYMSNQFTKQRQGLRLSGTQARTSSSKSLFFSLYNAFASRGCSLPPIPLLVPPLLFFVLSSWKKIGSPTLVRQSLHNDKTPPKSLAPTESDGTALHCNLAVTAQPDRATGLTSHRPLRLQHQFSRYCSGHVDVVKVINSGLDLFSRLRTMQSFEDDRRVRKYGLLLNAEGCW